LNIMTAPGGASGEDAADPHAAGAQHPQQPGWAAPWDSPASPPPAGYPPPGYAVDYPQFTPPFGYQLPPGYGPAYPPGPPQFSGPPPGYGSPPYTGGYYGDYWSHEAARTGTNGMAIAALISSFTGLLCCIGGIVAIVLGTIALDQIKRTRQDGYGLAVAGIVIGIATLIVTLIVMIFAVHSH
jgi:Domain of unknown function (DUF4190)